VHTGVHNKNKKNDGPAKYQSLPVACTCVFVCVIESAREKEIDRARTRKSKRAGARARARTWFVGLINSSRDTSEPTSP